MISSLIRLAITTAQPPKMVITDKPSPRVARALLTGFILKSQAALRAHDRANAAREVGV